MILQAPTQKIFCYYKLII